MKNKIEAFLKDMTYASRFRVLEEGADDDKLNEIASKRGIKLPAHDLAVFECIYAFVDRKNKNGCTLPKEEVEKALDTLVGKAVDFDHLRKRVVGTWIDSRIEDDKIIAYGTFFKGNFPEDFDEIKELMDDGVLAVSFEAWGDREFEDASQESYNLSDIEFAGGALLIRTEPAFDGAGVLELAKAKKERVFEMAKVMKAPDSFIRKEKASNREEARLFDWDMEHIQRTISQIDNLDGETKGWFEIQMIDFENSKIKLLDLTTQGELMVDLAPSVKVTKKGKQPNVSKIEDLTKATEIKDVNEFVSQFDGSDESLEILIESSIEGPKVSHTERLELTDEDFAIVKNFTFEESKRKIRLLPILDLAHIESALQKLQTEQAKNMLTKFGLDIAKVSGKVIRRANKIKMEELIKKIQESSLEEVLQDFAKASIERDLTEVELEKAYSLANLKPGGSMGEGTSLLAIPVRKSAGNETSLINASDVTEDFLKQLVNQAVETAKKEAEQAQRDEAIAKAESEKDKELATLKDQLAKANELIAQFEKAEKTAKVNARREELTEEFAKDMSDEDILDDVKFEMAKKDKRIAELESASANPEKKKLVKGSADKESMTEEQISRNNVNRYAWGSVNKDEEE